MLRLVLVILIISFVSSAKASLITKENRDLIAVVNLSLIAKKHQAMYRYEESRAVMKIKHDLAPYYRKTHIYSGIGATRANLLKAIQESEIDPEVKAVDTIIYVHGLPGELGFIDTGFYPTSRLRDEILYESPKKLRALYSDACYGESHLADWIKAGYRVASGSIEMDTNWSVDLSRFMAAWRKDRTFGKGIREANSVRRTKLTDWLIRKGNSFKETQGDLELRIDSPLE